MDLDRTAIAAAIDSAPAWAKLALTTRREQLREDARNELASHIVRSLDRPQNDPNQLALPL